MSPLTEALVRLRQVANEHDQRVGESSGFSADVTLVAQAVIWAADQRVRVHLEHAEMADLLREYSKRGADIVSPSPVSLIGRTRALLARIEAAP